MKKLIIFLVIAAAATGGWFYFKGGEHKDKKGDARPPVAVSVAAAERKDVPFKLNAVGSVVTGQSVAVRARVDSQLVEVKFKDGDEVKQGDLLFVLDDRAMKSQVEQLEANLVRDRAQLDDFKRQYDRKKSLADKGYETTANLDDARAQYEVQKATLASTSAAIDNLRTQLEYTRITAPISGRTGTINVTVGNTVKANDATPLVTINQMRPIRVQVSVPQKYLDTLRQALAAGSVDVIATHEGGKGPSAGKLDYIDNTVDAATGTFIARASFPNDEEALWPGMFVSATIAMGDEKKALTVPEVAVQHGQDGDFVFVVANGKAEKRPVKVKRLQDGVAVLESGVTDGEQVTVDGMMKLENGSSVSVGDAAGEEVKPQHSRQK